MEVSSSRVHRVLDERRQSIICVDAAGLRRQRLRDSRSEIALVAKSEFAGIVTCFCLNMQAVSPNRKCRIRPKLHAVCGLLLEASQVSS